MFGGTGDDTNYPIRAFLIRNVYKERSSLQNHSNYVAVVFYLEEEGWICTGSNDSTICIYTSGSIVPILTLKDHKATGWWSVSALKSW